MGENNQDKKCKRSLVKESVREAPLTYDDYASMPDDGMRYELAAGQLEAITPTPHPNHQLILSELVQAIKDTCSTDYIIFFAPVDVIFSDIEVRQPDLVMLHRSRLSLLTNRGIEGPPDLVAEVLSPSTIKRDRGDKRRSYAKYGVPEYWIIDMNNKHLEQYVFQGDEHKHDYELAEVYNKDDPVRSSKIPCVSFSMKDIMESLPELPN